jgi:homoserine dehydrogenase
VADCPVFSLFRGSLPAARLLGFAGVFNSTTNVILDEIGGGGAFDDGVRRAQALGVAETDPAHDVDGWDAAVKACALANVLLGARLRLEEVEREGIRGLSVAEVRAAHAEGRPFRLVARARRDDDGRVSASVRPEQVEPRGPFGAVNGTTLAVHYELDVLPGLTVVAHDPDLKSTAYGLLADFIEAVRGDL